MASGRAQPSPQGQLASQVVFFAGLTVAVAAFLYLRANKLSVMDGSATDVHTALSPADDTAVAPSFQPARERV